MTTGIQLPPTMKAVVVQETKTVVLGEKPVPEIGDNEILIKVEYVAVNPTDWKHVKRITRPGAISGCEIVGQVVKIGPNQNPNKPFKLGDGIAAGCHGGYYLDNGGFAEYIRTVTDLTWKVPDNVSHEQAATVSVGAYSAAMCMTHPKRLNMTEWPHKVPDGQWFLVYSGSTAVGHYAVQLAHLSGYKVVATASSSNHGALKGFGADVVFDYRDPDLLAKVKAVTGGALRIALDCFSSADSQQFSVEAMGSEGGKVLVVTRPNPKAAALRSDVSLQLMLLYSVFNKPFEMLGTVFPASQDDYDHICRFSQNLPQLLESGLLKPMKVKLWEGGLGRVAEALQYLEDGKVKAEKLVIKV